MLKITRTANDEVVFTVSSRMDTEHLAELKTLFSSEASGRRIILELKELTLVDQDAQGTELVQLYEALGEGWDSSNGSVSVEGKEHPFFFHQ